jgi:hypothetical protein
MKYLERLPVAIATACVIWCVWVGVRIWNAPIVFEGMEWMTEPGGIRTIPRVSYRTFSDVSQYGMFPLAVPVVVAALAWLAAWQKRILALAIVTLVFLALWVVAGFSIGRAYTPAAVGLVLATLAAMMTNRRETGSRVKN